MSEQETKVIKVDESVTQDIFRKDVAAKSMQDVISSLISGDSGRDERLTEQPVFQSYQKQYEEKLMEYQEAKAAMAKKYVPNGAKAWTLDYSTSELTVTF